MRRVRASVVNLFYAAVILTAAFKSIVFAATIYAENHIDQVEQWASRITGIQVQIEDIRASWSGLLPKIWLTNLSIGNDEKLHLGNVRVNINHLSLPWWRTNLPLDIKLAGTHIHILREATGETRVLGLGGKSPTYNSALPAHIHIQDASILWEDKKHGGAEMQLKHMDVHLTSRDNRSNLIIKSPQQNLLIRSELQGNILSNDWSADTYLRSSRLEADGFTRPYLPEQYTLEELNLGLESWSQWRAGRHVASQAKLQLHQLELRHSDGQRLVLDSASADMQFRRNANHWRLQFSNFTNISSKGQWPATDILLDLSTAASGLQHLRIGISQIPIHILNRLSVIFRPPGNLNRLLTQLAPGGRLEKVQAHLVSGDSAEISLLHMTANFTGLSNRAWKHIPATRNLTGQISVAPRQIQVDFNTRDADVVFPGLFRTPLPLSLLRGQINWQAGATGGWRLDSNELIVETPDLKTISRIALKAHPDHPLFVDIQTDFRDGAGANAGTYYPVGIMTPKLVAWLDRSIVSGSVPSGSFLLHGPLKGFPYHETHSGHFEVLFDARDLVLNYHTGWPALNEGVASIRFHNNELQINAESANILGSRIRETHAHIPTLKPGSAIHIQGSASGPMKDILRLVRETPLREKYATSVEGMQAYGRADSSLSLSIPLSKSAAYQFNSQLTLQSAGLTLTQHQLDMTNIYGQLNLNLNGIYAKNISFNVLGTKMNMDMSQSDHASTLIKLTGVLPIAEVQKQYSFLQPLAARGAAHTVMQLDLPNNRQQAQSAASLDIHSELEGIDIDMPTPLSKSSNIARSLDVNLLLDSPQTDVRINYADQVQLHITQNQAADYRITGAIEQLPLHEWLSWYNQMPQQATDSFNLDRLDINVKEFSLVPFATSDLKIDIRRKQQHWLGELASDNLQGSFRVPAEMSSQPLTIELDKLALSITEETEQDYIAPLPEDNLNPLSIPPLNFNCKNLMIGDAPLGELKLKARRSKDGIIIDTASIHGRHVTSKITGAWVNHLGGTSTRLKGELISSNMGHLLETIYGATAFADSKTNLNFDLNWKGAPFQYHPANVKGTMNLDVGKGRVLDIDPGAARMLGLLNVRSLNRRLQLDFSDLYKEGLSFDSINGSFYLGVGHIYSNDLTIKSPAALIHLSGSADLVHKQLDQLVTVSPKLDTTLPLAGAIIGGPATGLAILLAQQVMSNPLSKLQRIKYSVQGPWNDTTITRIKLEKEAAEVEDILDL